MAFETGTATSFTNLITKLNTFMVANGWTNEELDTTTNPTTGGEWAMRRTAGATNLRFAASWDAANTPNRLALYHYVDQNYDTAVRPWAQDNDSGNGFEGKADASIANERHVIIGTGTSLTYWIFEDDDYTHVVVETSSGVYAHFGFGMLDKFGQDWTGGEYVYGQRNSGTTGSTQATRDDRCHILDGYFNDTADGGGLSDDSELLAPTIHCEDLPNQATNGLFAVNMGGGTLSGKTTQTDFGFDRQSNDGSSSDIARGNFTWGYRSGWFVNSFYTFDGTDVSGHVAMWPVCLTWEDGSNIHGFPIARMKGVRGINMRNWSGGDTFEQGGDTWHVFPAHKKWLSGAQTGTSGWLGIAYKKVS